MSHDQNTPHPEMKADLPDQEVADRVPGAGLPEDSSPTLVGRRPGAPRRGRRTVAPEAAGPQPQLTPQQRLLALDTWMKSGLPAGDYAPLIGVSKHSICPVSPVCLLFCVSP